MPNRPPTDPKPETSTFQHGFSATVSDGPDLAARNVSYAGNRAPLQNTPFIKLPVGAIQPKGWLLEYLRRQRDGLTGSLGTISAWLQKDDNAWFSKEGKGKWGWEELPYWLKGYASLAFTLGDHALIDETMVWINGVLDSQRADGNFGPTQVDEKGAEDFWPKMIMLYCLQSYYEHAGDQRVLAFMERFFAYQLQYPEETFMQMYWQSRRTGDNLHSVLWLYNLTGTAWLLELAHKLHRKSVDWAPRQTAPEEWFAAMPDWHNVNIAQGFREPGEYSQLSGNPKDLKASYDAFFKVREHFGQVPGGMFGGDENSRKGYDDPRQGVETCGMVEQMNSDEELFRITGDTFWADHAENVAFNTYPAAVMPDFKSLRYLTSPNMVLNDDQDHSPGIDNRGPFLMMNPFSSRCCQHNHAQGWPYYSENLWLATSDNGVAAVLYAASEVSLNVANGVPVTIALKTNYPFADKLRFTVKIKGKAEFPLYLRVPAWCQKPELAVNGVAVSTDGATGKYLKIARVWSNRDTVVLRLPMAITVRTWEKNKDSVSIDYGPLTFSLRIGEEYVQKPGDATAIGDSQWQAGVDKARWPAYEIHPTTPWNYGLLLDGKSPCKVTRRRWPKNDFPFTPDACPVQVSAKARRIPEWTLDEHGLCGVLMQSPVKTTEPVEIVTLIPMGAARLRISAFPTITTG